MQSYISIYSSEWDCDAGNIWVDAKALYISLFQIEYFRNRQNLDLKLFLLTRLAEKFQQDFFIYE